MKRVVIGLAVLATGVVAVLGYTATTREREYSHLVAVGEAALAADQTFGAIEAFSGAIALKSDSMLAYLKRGETYRQRGDLSAALRDLRRAAELDPSAPRPLEQLGDVNYERKRYARAAEHYAAYVRLDDHDARVLYKLGLAHYRNGHSSTAIPPLRRAVELQERFSDAHYLLGLCLRDEEQTAGALAALRRAVDLDPAGVRAREALAHLYQTLGRTSEEIDQLEALAALDPGRPERQVILGLAYARAGRTDLAVLALGRTAERYPEHAQVYPALARVWLDLAEARRDRVALSKALDALQSALVGAPTTSELLTLQARALLLTGDPTTAERVLQQATGRFPVEPAAFRLLASLAERRRDWAQARQALVHFDTLAQDRGDAQTHAADAIRIGDLSLRLSEPAVALAWFERAVQLQTPDGETLARLAEARWLAGDLDGARQAVTDGLARDPRNSSLAVLRRRMRAASPD